MDQAKRWLVEPYGFDPHEIAAPTRDAAKYADWKLAQAAGYFTGRDGFWRYLVSGVRVREITPALSDLPTKGSDHVG